MVLAIIAAIVAAAVLGTHARHAQHARYKNSRWIVPSPSNSSPIRAAILTNFPDPALWYDNGTWYAYATNNAAGIQHVKNANASENTINFGLANVQLATSPDFQTWTLTSLTHEPLPIVGAWSQQQQRPHNPNLPQPLSGTWAPGVGRRADGRYVMYYAAPKAGINPRPQHPHPHCVGAAVSVGDSARGPYEAEEDVLACPAELGGAIDPEVYSENNVLWVVYKVDGNNVGSGGDCGNTFPPIQPTPLLLQKMFPNGTVPSGPPIPLLDRIPSDGPLIEAPKLIRSAEGIYFLFFSSGCTRDPSYAIKYATATHLTGPYTRAEGTFLKTGDWGLLAPGSVGIHQEGDREGRWRMAFHARVLREGVGGVRGMFTTGVEFRGRVARVVRGDD